MKWAMVSVLFGAILPILLPQSVAVCCRFNLFSCCGYHPCNIFCCNCGGPPKCDRGGNCGICSHPMCQHKRYQDSFFIKWGKRETKPRTPIHLQKGNTNDTEERFAMVDINRDKFISIEEADIFFKAQEKKHYPIKRSANSFDVMEEIIKLDTNGDGLLSPKEFDDDLQN